MHLLPVLLNPPRKKAGGKKVAATKRKGRRKKSTKGRSTRTGYKKSKATRPITWVEAARSSGAVKPTGKIMTKSEALTAKRPVVGYLTRNMINHWHGPKGGARANRKTAGGRARFKKSVEWWTDAEAAKSVERKLRGSAWLRKKPKAKPRGRYKRSGTTKAGRKYKKGQSKPRKKVKPDFYFDSAGKLKFRKGRGPYTSVKLFRGFSPTKAQIKRLVAGGFAGHLSAPGGKVKFNRPKRRRKKATRRRKPPRSKKTGRYLKTGSNPKHKRRRAKKNTKRKAKRSMAVYNNPKKKRRRKKRRKARRNPSHKGSRKKYRRSVAKNPRKKRKKRRGRRRGYRRNPFGLALPAQLAQLKNMKFWATALHVGIGMGLTGLTSNMLLGTRYGTRLRVMPGIGGALGRAAVNAGSASLVAFAGDKLSKVVGGKGALGKYLQGAGRNMLIGGLVYTLVQFAYDAAPALAGKILPGVQAPRGPRAFVGGGGGGGGGGDVAGMNDWLELSGMGGGMGMVLSPEDLVSGESLARQVNEFSGVGSSGGSPIPLEDLRGYPGQYGGGGMGSMNDWVEFAPGSAMVEAGFNPGTEPF